MTGGALFKLLLKWLKTLNLEVKNIVAQSYDGASAMRGIYRGIAARLKEVAPCDTIITFIENRFDENMIDDILLMEKLFLTKVLLNENELKQLSKQYSLSYDDLRGEQRLYKAKLPTSQATLPEIRSSILENHLNVCLPVMNELFKILWAIPVNTCLYESSFSILRRIKNYLRSPTREDCLSGLTLLNIEHDAEIDYDEIIKEFVPVKKSRKIVF
ncbi:unnamed protein product [Rotaria sp. Silwood1]|nr:unnamed protein product [Rotaria sp. Silwood1]CAF1567667.1 unnamed protein product [Rotaria sp. Silwood1]